MKRKKKQTEPQDPPYFKVSHITVSSPEFKSLPLSAQVLFYTLCRLRNRLAKGFNHNPDMTFWRYEKDLLYDSGLPRSTFHRARKKLLQLNFIHFTRNSPPKYTICDDVYSRQQEQHRDPDALNKNPLEVLP